MTMQVTYLGKNEDGTPHYHYESPDGHLVITGPAQGPITTADGTGYEVSPAVIEVKCDGHDEDGNATGTCHADEVSHHIGMLHNAHGHPKAPGFEYDPEPFLAAQKKGH